MSKKPLPGDLKHLKFYSSKLKFTRKKFLLFGNSSWSPCKGQRRPVAHSCFQPAGGNRLSFFLSFSLWIFSWWSYSEWILESTGDLFPLVQSTNFELAQAPHYPLRVRGREGKSWSLAWQYIWCHRPCLWALWIWRQLCLQSQRRELHQETADLGPCCFSKGSWYNKRQSTPHSHWANTWQLLVSVL